MAEGLTAEEKEIIHHMPSRLESFAKERSSLIPILQMVQESLGYLLPEVIDIVAGYLDLTETEVYGVATFYNQFRFIPPGKNPIKVCLGTACHVKGGDIILENFERKLEIKEGETTPDREFSIERVACVGCCAIAPVALVSETVHGDMAPSKVEGLILRIQVEKEKAERENQKE
ncbi:MAG: NADH-quinone oxidoreductase subunit NuoE [Desulfobacterales bacterium]|nr:NADH-quinone oxidoreductase subunit NuoE [Desulfobacterales bacterium]